MRFIEGAFVFTIIDDRNNLQFAKGDNPLVLYHYNKYGFNVKTRTEAIFDRRLDMLEKHGVDIIFN